LPDALSDRDQDNWEPLIAIASCAGQEWEAQAIEVALKLTGTGGKAASIGNELLADIQQAFDIKRVNKFSLAGLAIALCEDEEAAWATYNRGKPLSVRQMSSRLTAYGIKSKSIRIANEVCRGYELHQFEDVFARYLSDTPIDSVTPLQNSTGTGSSVTGKGKVIVMTPQSVTPEAPPLLGCNNVTDVTPFSGGIEATFPEASHLRI
jgi:putative DNA primase/helicase